MVRSFRVGMVKQYRQGDVILERYVVDELVEASVTEQRFVAEHTTLGNLVIVRRYVGASDSTSLARFERSVVMMGRVRSAHVASLLDYGVEDGCPILVIECVDGMSLRDALTKRTSLAWQEAVVVAKGILHGVAALHAEDVLHRNIRPETIYVTGDGDQLGAKLTGLELAKSSKPKQQRVTAIGRAVGTPLYMAPEQLNLDQTDTRTDLYTVALVLFEMLTGQMPEGGKSRMALARRLVAEPPLPKAPSERPPIPPALQRMVVKGLARDPSARYQTAPEFIDAVESALLLAEDENAKANRVLPLWRTKEAPPRRTRVLRLQLTTAERGRALGSSHADAPKGTGPIYAMVACRLRPDANAALRSDVETHIERVGDSYRLSDTAWVGLIRASTVSAAVRACASLVRTLEELVSGRGAVVSECVDRPIDVPEATLIGLAPPTVEMMRLLERASNALSSSERS